MSIIYITSYTRPSLNTHTHHTNIQTHTHHTHSYTHTHYIHSHALTQTHTHTHQIMMKSLDVSFAVKETVTQEGGETKVTEVQPYKQVTYYYD